MSHAKESEANFNLFFFVTEQHNEIIVTIDSCTNQSMKGIHCDSKDIYVLCTVHSNK